MSSSYKIAASILAADFTRLGDQVREAEAAGADLFHMDIMDGMFVPNISFGPMIVEAVRGISRLPLCAHLMVEKPERYVPAFAQAGANMIVVHVEASPHLHSTIQQIRSLNVRAGVAISPHTPFEMTREILSDVDHVLVLTVSPGFGGQKFIHSTLPKIEQIASAARRIDHPLEIGVDGGINPTTIGLVLEKGANVIIAGTAIFRTTGGIAAGIAALRTAAQSR